MSDGCNELCQVEAGFVCSPYEEAGVAQGDRCVAVCGDCLRVGAEGCDDCNVANGDGCSSTCQVEVGYGCYARAALSNAQLGAALGDYCVSLCGDGDVVALVEECDDGNRITADGCS